VASWAELTSFAAEMHTGLCNWRTKLRIAARDQKGGGLGNLAWSDAAEAGDNFEAKCKIYKG
jgi:hypothetical protein